MPRPHNWPERRRNGSRWAKSVLADPEATILKVVTTGMDELAEIVGLALVRPGGYSSERLFKPRRKIPIDAYKIHGVSQSQVDVCETFAEQAHVLNELFNDCSQLIIYNASFDLRMLIQSDGRMNRQLDHPALAGKAVCLMHAYAVWTGDWNDHHQTYIPHKLPGATKRALPDAHAALDVLKVMATADDQVELAFS